MSVNDITHKQILIANKKEKKWKGKDVITAVIADTVQKSSELTEEDYEVMRQYEEDEENKDCGQWLLNGNGRPV